MLNDDYREMLSILSEEKVKFLVIGAFALSTYGYPRATDDIEVPVISLDDLIKNKESAGREKDLLDVKMLKKQNINK